MAKLTSDVKKAISLQEIFPVDTCNQNWIPNVIYIKYLKVIDDNTVLIADNYLSKTRDNIVNNGKIAFVVLNSDKGSYQIKGISERFEKGPMYDEIQRWVPEKYPRAAAVVMKVEEIYKGAERIG